MRLLRTSTSTVLWVKPESACAFLPRFIFIVFASEKKPAEMLELLETRIRRSRAQEMEAAANEQAKITRHRLERWIHEQQQ